MPFITMTGTENDAQGIGTIVNPNEALPMMYNVLAPDNYYPLTGSYMTGGPSYTETDAVTATVREFDSNGERSDSSETIKEAKVERIDLTVEDAPFPIHMLQSISRLQQANRSLQWHLIVQPRNCGSGCGDQYYKLYRKAKVGGTRESQALWGADLTEIESASNRTISISKEHLQYDALSNVNAIHNSGGDALYGILIIDEKCSDGGICPYQKQVVTGAGGYAKVTLDKWASSSTIDSTVIPAGPPTQDNIVSPIVVKGNLIAGFTDVPNGTGTDGGILIATPAADGTFNAFELATINGAASKGVNRIIQAGNKLYAGGADQLLVSCDFGQSWSHVTLPAGLSAQTILDMVFDPLSQYVFIAASNSAWVYTGSNFTEITTQVRGTSGLSNPFRSVQVLKADAIQFGDSAGNLYTHYQYSRGTNFTVSEVGASGIDAIVSDEYLTRSVLAIGDAVLIKQPGTDGAYETLYDTGGDVSEIIAGKPLAESGTNYYLAVNDTGLLIEIASCGICVESGC
jgi:hypothetical protein